MMNGGSRPDLQETQNDDLKRGTNLQGICINGGPFLTSNSASSGGALGGIYSRRAYIFGLDNGNDFPEDTGSHLAHGIARDRAECSFLQLR